MFLTCDGESLVEIHKMDVKMLQCRFLSLTGRNELAKTTVTKAK